MPRSQCSAFCMHIRSETCPFSTYGTYLPATNLPGHCSDQEHGLPASASISPASSPYLLTSARIEGSVPLHVPIPDPILLQTTHTVQRPIPKRDPPNSTHSASSPSVPVSPPSRLVLLAELKLLDEDWPLLKSISPCAWYEWVFCGVGRGSVKAKVGESRYIPCCWACRPGWMGQPGTGVSWAFCPWSWTESGGLAGSCLIRRG